MLTVGPLNSAVVPTRVSVPCSFYTDPDPAVYAEYRSGSRVLMTKKWKKFTAEKKTFGSKTTIYLSLGPHKGLSSYRKFFSSQKKNIQHFKTWNFLIFCYFCGSFFPSGPDPIRIRIWNPGSHKNFRIRMDYIFSFCHCCGPEPQIFKLRNRNEFRFRIWILI